MPGTAPAPIGPVTVTAGQTSAGHRLDAHRHAAALRPVRGPVKRQFRNRWRALATSARLRDRRGLWRRWRRRQWRRRKRPAQHHDHDARRRRRRRGIQRDGGRQRRNRRQDLQHQRRRAAGRPFDQRRRRDSRARRRVLPATADFTVSVSDSAATPADRHAGAFDHNRRSARHRDGQRARHSRGRRLQRRHRSQRRDTALPVQHIRRHSVRHRAAG